MGNAGPYPFKPKSKMKPNIWVSSAQADEMLAKQQRTWSLAYDNYQALRQVRVKAFQGGDFEIKALFNPARVVSTGARVDRGVTSAEDCFLCVGNLPIEQERLPFGYHYLVLCNPYPIFPAHFTIPSRRHEPQRILPRIGDLLTLARRLDRHTIFYNGPRCGASLPGHAHFQAVTHDAMPIDLEIERWRKEGDESHLEPLVHVGEENRIWRLTRYWRSGFVIEGNEPSTVAALFRRVYEALPREVDEEEPKMNVFASYQASTWRLTVVPRRAHRPWQYAAEGDERLMCSPGAADVGGCLVLPVERDFERMDAALAFDVFRQVCFSDEEVRAFKIF